MNLKSKTTLGILRCIPYKSIPYQLLCLICCILLVVETKAQSTPFKFEVKFNDSSPKTAYLSLHNADNYKFIKSLPVTDGKVVFNSKESGFEQGIYKLSIKDPKEGKIAYNPVNAFDIYLHKENVQVTCNNVDLSGSLKILKGEEALKVLRITSMEAKFKNSMRQSLQKVWGGVPPNEIEAEQTKYDQSLNQLGLAIKKEGSGRNKGLQAILNLYQGVPFVFTNSPNSTLPSIIEEYKETYDINHPAAVRTPLFKTRLKEYISLYYDRSMSFSKTQQKLKKAVQSILYFTRNDKEVQFNAMVITTNTLRRNGMDETLLEIDRLFIQKNPKFANSVIANTIKPYRSTAIGKRASNIALNDVNQKPYDMYKSTKKNFIITFYSSGCSHCQKEMPKLKTWFEQNQDKNLDFIAFSLDKDKQKLMDFINKESLPFINIGDYKSWDSPVIDAYNVHGTPTIFILDENKTIRNKVISVEEIDAYFN